MCDVRRQVIGIQLILTTMQQGYLHAPLRLFVTLNELFGNQAAN